MFTLIEPPNNWFESSDQPTVVATDSEGSYSCSEQGCSPGARAIAANWAATTTEAVEGPLPGKEAGHVALGHTSPVVRSEGEGRRPYTRPRDRVSGETLTAKEEGLVTGASRYLGRGQPTGTPAGYRGDRGGRGRPHYFLGLM